MVDKMYVMYHTLNFHTKTQLKEAWDAFYKDPKNADIVDEINENEEKLLKQYIDNYTEDSYEDLSNEELDDYFNDMWEWLSENGKKRYDLSETAQIRFKEWLNEHSEAYQSTSIKVVDFKFSEEINEEDPMEVFNHVSSLPKSARDSLMIDLMYSVLTNKDTLGEFTNPGGFVEPKRVARAVTILNSLSLSKFRELFKNEETFLDLPLFDEEDIEGLDNLAQKYQPLLSPITPNTWVKLHQRNMSGASLISVAATNNAGHAMMQNTNLGIYETYQFTFNGHRFDSLHDIKTPDGKFITRNVSSFLAAFVDNGKDPIAGDMNFNMTTAPIAFALLRAGVSPITVGLFISQPLVKEVVKKVNNKKVDLNTAIQQTIDEFKSRASKEHVRGKFTENGISSYNFTDKELATNILSMNNSGQATLEEETYANTQQLKIGFILSKIARVASDLNDITRVTRSDTQGGAAGPGIADTMTRINLLNKVISNSMGLTYSLTGTEFLDTIYGDNDIESIINHQLPILKAFETYGLLYTEKLLNRYFPYYNSAYRKVIEDLSEFTKYGNLTAKTINSVYNDLVSFYLTQYGSFGKNTYTVEVEGPTGEMITKEVSARDYFINHFPRKFKQIKQDHPELLQYSLINRLKGINKTKYNPAPSIIFNNVGKVTDVQKNQYMQDWESLLYNEDTAELARELFAYCCYKGFGFSPSGFSHLIPTAVKLDNSDYIETLNRLYTTEEFPVDFVRMYIRNHLHNRELVHSVNDSVEALGIKIDDKTESFDINFGAEADINALHQFIQSRDSDGGVIPFAYIVYNKAGQNFCFELSEVEGDSVTYTKVEPLGLKNQYVEYSFDESADEIESVIPKAEQRKTSNNYESKLDSYEYDEYSEYEKADREISMGVGIFAQMRNQLSTTDREVLGISDKTELSEAAKLDNLAPQDRDPYTNEEFCGGVKIKGQQGVHVNGVYKL